MDRFWLGGQHDIGSNDHAQGAGGHRAEGRGYGLVFFAAILLLVVGFFNLIYDMMFFVPAYPFWALTIIAMDVVALYGLCAYGSRQNIEAT
jgi:UPF0716 family protein affecting phage T7 exclusion